MKKLISIVISAYNEELVVEELSLRLAQVFDQNPNYDFEAIIVENGSTDHTYERLVEIHKRNPRFKVVQLARNFGMDGGITAGLRYATGDAAVMMTANLQDPPDVIPRFIEEWEKGYENVYGIVASRPGKGLFRRINSQLFYMVSNKMTKNLIPKNVSDFRLVDRRVYETINGMEERVRLIRGMFAWAGFRSKGVRFERNERFAGESHAHFFGVLQLAIRGIFAFSDMPIKVISLVGLLLSGASLCYLIFTVIRIFVKGVPFAGYGTIVSLIILMFGILFFILGVLGQYIAQIYDEVKARPNFIVRREMGFDRGRRSD